MRGALLIAVGAVSALAACATPKSELGDDWSRDMSKLDLRDLEGKPRSLSELEGKVVWLDFWATWCAPCLDSMPVYDAWQVELADRGLQVVLVSVDEDLEAIGPFAQKHAPHALILHDPQGASAERMELSTMPTAFLIDREGNVVLEHAGFRDGDAEELKKKLLQQLAQGSGQSVDGG